MDRQTLSRLRAVTLLGLAVSMLLAAVVLIAAPQQASAATSCTAGTQQGLLCEIEGTEPTAGPDGLACADGFDLDGGRCVRYEVVDGVELDCPAGTLVLATCVVTGALPEPIGPPQCPVSPSVLFVDGECYTTTSPAVLEECPDGATLEPSGDSCAVPVDLVSEQIVVDPECPTGYSASDELGGICATTQPALRADGACPTGSRGTAGSCYVISKPQGSCDEGTLVGDNCVVVGDPPVNSPATCPVSATVFEDGPECFALVPSLNGTCAPPLRAEAETDLCRRNVDLRPGPLVCSVGFAPLIGNCIRYVSPSFPISGSVCPPGAALDDFGYCQLPVPDRTTLYWCQAGTLTGSECLIEIPANSCDYAEAVTGCSAPEAVCPAGLLGDISSSAVCVVTENSSQRPEDCPYGSRGAPGGCYILVAKGPAEPGFFPQCPVGSVEDGTGQCRRPVANARGAYYCANPFAALIGRNCVLVAEAIAPCASEPLAGTVPCDDDGCPPGFTVDANDPTVCAQFVPASASSPSCPPSALGTAGNCYGFAPLRVSDSATCTEGTRTALDLCQLSGQILSTELVCPTSSTVFQDGDACYALVDAPRERREVFSPPPCSDTGFLVDDDLCVDIITCGAPLTDDPSSGLCRWPVSLRSVPAACETGFVVTGERCIAFVPAVHAEVAICQNPWSPRGAGCIYPVGDAVGDPYCEDPNDELTFTNQCLAVAPFVDSCPADVSVDDCRPRPAFCPFNYSPDDSLGGICARFEPAPQGPPTCPDGARGEPGDCYILVARGPAPVQCPDGAALVGSNCVIVGNAPQDVSGVALCDAGFGIVNGQCIRYVEPTESGAPCPAGNTEDDDGNCRKPVADAAGAYFCADEAAALNGRSCVFTTGFDYGCNPSNGACGTIQITESCPAVSDGDRCYEVVQLGFGCPPGSTSNADATSCQVPVEFVDQALACVAPFGLVDGACIRTLQPIGFEDLDCLGEDASACDDVVLSSQDALPSDDLISARPTSIEFYGCSGATATFSVTGESVVVASGALAETSSGFYTGTYEVPAAGIYELEVSFTCPDEPAETATAQLVFIDPSGFILDCAGDVVSGATVTLTRADGVGGPFTIVADGDASIMDPTVNVRNPTTTGPDGRYRWDVVAGFYVVTATIAGQDPVSSQVLAVPPPQTDVDLTFPNLNCAIVVTDPEPTATPTPNPTATPTADVVADPEPTATATPDPTATAIPSQQDRTTTRPAAVTFEGVAQPPSTTTTTTNPAPAAAPLQIDAETRLAVTGVESDGLALLGASLLAAGSGLVALSLGCRRFTTRNRRREVDTEPERYWI